MVVVLVPLVELVGVEVVGVTVVLVLLDGVAVVELVLEQPATATAITIAAKVLIIWIEYSY